MSLKNAPLHTSAEKLRAFIDHQTELLSASKPRGMLFHYSSLEGFLGIVTSRKIWASDVFSLNDESEIEYFHALLVEVLNVHLGAKSSSQRVSLVHQLKSLMKGYNPFVSCFCEDGDLLSQWRGYGGYGQGISIGFDSEWLVSKTPDWHLLRVLYDRKKQLEMLNKFCVQVLNEWHSYGSSSELQEGRFWSLAIAQLTPWVIFFKDPSFQEENEWRLASTGTVAELRFRSSGRRVIAYTEIELEDSSLTKIVRGPYFKRTDKHGFELSLRYKAFHAASKKISDSAIPLRP